MDKLAAPNGVAGTGGPGVYAFQTNGGQERQGLPDLCGEQDYTGCSYADELTIYLLEEPSVDIVPPILFHPCPGHVIETSLVHR